MPGFVLVKEIRLKFLVTILKKGNVGFGIPQQYVILILNVVVLMQPTGYLLVKVPDIKMDYSFL